MFTAHKKTYCFIMIFLLGMAVLSDCMAATGTLNVSAVVLSKSNCLFENPASNTLDFGNLDPLNPVDVVVNTPFTFVCRGSAPVATYLITDDDGLHETGANANRMQNTIDPSAYLPYSISLNPTMGNAPKNVDQLLTVTGTVLGTDYQTARLGAYTDQVIISIQP